MTKLLQVSEVETILTKAVEEAVNEHASRRTFMKLGKVVTTYTGDGMARFDIVIDVADISQIPLVKEILGKKLPPILMELSNKPSCEQLLNLQLQVEVMVNVTSFK